MNAVAREFLSRCFEPGSTIAVLLRSAETSRTQQRVVTLDQAIAARYLAWLRHQNDAGADIYVAANPLKPGSRKRTKECIASVRHLYLDIDQDGDRALARLRSSDEVPLPNAILTTSPAKYQVLWHVEGFDSAQQEATLKQLATTFGGDPACTDCNRVLRLPGYLNQKYAPAYSVTVEYGFDRVAHPSDFRLPDALSNREVCRSQKPCIPATRKDSQSEQDWAWACAQLSAGADANKLTRLLAERRSDKPNPLYYAQRTIDVASARQWFLIGAPLGDVITMLEDRHRFDLSPNLCTVRAREIAATAQRMIARRKLA